MYYLLLFLREGLKVYLSLLCLETHPSQPVSSSRTLPLAKLSSLTQTGPSLLYAGLRLWLVALGMLIPGTQKGHHKSSEEFSLRIQNSRNLMHVHYFLQSQL